MVHSSFVISRNGNGFMISTVNISLEMHKVRRHRTGKQPYFKLTEASKATAYLEDKTLTSNSEESLQNSLQLTIALVLVLSVNVDVIKRTLP